MVRIRDILLAGLILYNAYHSRLLRVALDFTDSHPDLPQIDAALGVAVKTIINLGLGVDVSNAERTDLALINRFRQASDLQYEYATRLLMSEKHQGCKQAKTCAVKASKIVSKRDSREIDVLAIHRLSDGPKPKRFILYLHPGGTVTGNMYSPIAFALAYELDAYVLSVGYRKSPEHVYPAALDDAFEVMLWVAEHGKDLVTEVNKLTIAGDSAGSMLAAALAIKWKRYGGSPAIHTLVLNIPMLSPVLSRSYSTYQDIHFLDARQMNFFWRMYALNVHDCVIDFECSPGTAPVDELKDIAKHALIMPARADVLRDEGIEFARKLSLAGVNTTLLTTKGTHMGSFIDPEVRSGRVLRLIDF